MEHTYSDRLVENATASSAGGSSEPENGQGYPPLFGGQGMKGLVVRTYSG